MTDHSAQTDINDLQEQIRYCQQKLTRLKSERAILQCENTPLGSTGRTVSELVGLGDMVFNVMEGHSIDLQSLHMENIHRLTGITAFEIKQVRGFGIRFEVFGSNCTYETPHYLILSKNNKGKLNVYRHTIPAFVPLRSLARRYLNTNLLTFVSKIRQYLYRYLFKRRLFLGHLPNVHKTEVDPAFRLIKLHLTDRKSTIMLVCGQTDIEKAIVQQTEGDRIIMRKWLPGLTGSLHSFIERLRAIELKYQTTEDRFD